MANNQLKTKFPMLFLLIAAILFVTFFTLNYLKIFNLQEWLYPGSEINESRNYGNGENRAGQIIAKVGNENIFQSDLDFEMMNYPYVDKDAKKILLEKITNDSIIIQSAQKDGFIKIDKTVFNSPQKDYLKRTELVNSIKNILDNRQDTISGYIITIYFNNKYPGEVGLEKGREIANSKITSLHNRVKRGQLSILQAAQEIIDDDSLTQVDPDYATNAIKYFEATPDTKITRDADFDRVIRNLKTGELSDVYAVKDLASGSENQQETSFMFAQVNERKNAGNNQDFESWYSAHKNKYEIVYY